LEVAKKVTGGGAAAPAPAAPVAEPVTEPAVNGANGATKEDIAQAKTADEVADTAEKLDSNEAKPAGP
jgi:peroxiredoxin Q/BCP